MSVVSSLLLGALLGLANASAAVLLARRGRTLGLNPAMKLVVGGGFARLALLLGVVVLVLTLVAVHQLAFLGGLGIVFVLGLVAEVSVVAGRRAAVPSGPSVSQPPADA